VVTRIIALGEYALLRAFDSCFQRKAADELLVVALKRE
jgi:hypothetical protein